MGSEWRLTKCPFCLEWLNGMTCSNCGKSPREADIVRCKDCNERVAKSRCNTTSHQAPISAQFRESNTCWRCQED